MEMNIRTSQGRRSSSPSRNSADYLEDNQDSDCSIIVDQEAQPERTASPESLLYDFDDDDDELSGIDISTLLPLVLAQGEEIVELRRTVEELNSKIDMQNQVIEEIKNDMRSAFLSWKKNEDEGEPGDRIIGPSTSTSGRGTNGSTIQDLSKETERGPRKRRMASERYLNQTKKIKVTKLQSHDHDEISSGTNKDEPCSAGAGSSSGFADDGNGSESEKEETNDPSFVPCDNLREDFTRRFSSVSKDRNREFSCANCQKLYTTKGALVAHIKSAHLNIKFPCPHCSGTFAQLVQLNKHLKLHAKGGPRLEKCEVCGMELNGKKGLMIHMGSMHKIYEGTLGSQEILEMVSTERDPFKCQVCERGFKKRDILRHHLSTTHEISGMEAETIIEKSSSAEEIGKSSDIASA